VGANGSAGAAAGGVLALIVLIIAGVIGVFGAIHLYKHKEKIQLFRLACKTITSNWI
jgi:uncharacterized membrane protein YsdA (DUF1294 family)